MKLAITELKIKAKKLLKATKFNNGKESSTIKLKDCHLILARKLGFVSWQQTSDYFCGVEKSATQCDHGTIWHEDRCSALTNHWFASYSDANQFKSEQPDLYILPFKRQFVVVDKEYLILLGLGNTDIKLLDYLNKNAVSSYGSESLDRLLLKRVRQTLNLDLIQIKNV